MTRTVSYLGCCTRRRLYLDGFWPLNKWAYAASRWLVATAVVAAVVVGATGFGVGAVAWVTAVVMVYP